MNDPHPPPPPERTGNKPAPARRWNALRTQAPVVAVVALGGAVGASGRFAASLLWPAAPGGFPWSTLLINVVGCALLGVFMVLVNELWTAHRLVRPFVGTGLLGGFTTFSAYASEVQALLLSDRARTGLAYLGVTLLAALAAVWTGVWLTRRVLARWRVSGRAQQEAVGEAGRRAEPKA